MQIIQNIDIFDYAIFKNLISSEGVIKERAATNWEKIYAMHVTNKNTISIMYKNQ